MSLFLIDRNPQTQTRTVAAQSANSTVRSSAMKTLVHQPYVSDLTLAVTSLADPQAQAYFSEAGVLDGLQRLVKFMASGGFEPAFASPWGEACGQNVPAKVYDPASDAFIEVNCSDHFMVFGTMIRISSYFFDVLNRMSRLSVPTPDGKGDYPFVMIPNGYNPLGVATSGASSSDALLNPNTEPSVFTSSQMNSRSTAQNGAHGMHDSAVNRGNMFNTNVVNLLLRNRQFADSVSKYAVPWTKGSKAVPMYVHASQFTSRLLGSYAPYAVTTDLLVFDQSHACSMRERTSNGLNVSLNSAEAMAKAYGNSASAIF